MAEDISKKTLFVFLVLTIFVSVLSTWTLIESVSQAEKNPNVPVSLSDNSNGRISLEISEPPESSTEGMVTLTVN